MTPSGKEISFSLRDAFIRRLASSMERERPVAFSLYLSSSPGSTRMPNQLEINYCPTLGFLHIEIYRPTTGSYIAELLAAVSKAFNVDFAFVDVLDRKAMSDDLTEKASYRADYAIYPHLQCLGWMAYLSQEISKEQLPSATAVLPAADGTVVVAVIAPFDIANTQHVQRANQIETSMNVLGLLAATDSTL